MSDDWSESERLYREGSSRMLRGEFLEAIELFKASFSLGPHSKTAELIGECFLRLSQSEEAILYLAASCGLGTRPRAAYLLGQEWFRRGELQDAQIALKRAVEQLPHYKIARKLLEEVEALIASRESSETS